MPELPDVEGLRRYLKEHALDRPIARTSVHDDMILGEVSASRLQRALKGAPLTGALRHGKYLFAPCSEGPALVLHFGMTGELAEVEAAEDEPEYTKAFFEFEDGGGLAYICPRRLGRIDLAEDIQGYLEGQDLGPDAADVDADQFRKIVGARRGSIKHTLMDQSSIAGLGNVYTDEILFQAGIHPKTTAADLDDDQLGELSRVMHRVLNTANKHAGNGEEVPDWWLIHRREEGATCGKCDGEIERIEVSGRGTFLCPACQQQP